MTMRLPTTAAVLLLLLPAPGAGQARADLIARAQQSFDAAEQLALLGQAIDPTTLAPDSLWAVSVHELAQILIDDDAALASTWLTWAARLHPELQLAADNYTQDVIQADAAARAAVLSRETLAEALVAESWEWPEQLTTSDTGRLQVSGPPGVAVTVDGRPVPDNVELAAGSYEVTAVADGFESMTVTREVLPGVTTSLEFDLFPVLDQAVRTRVNGGLVTVSSVRGGQTTCQTGFLAGDGAFIVTALDAIQGADVVRVRTSAGVESEPELRTMESDESHNLAVLTAESLTAGALSFAGNPAVGDRTWTFHVGGCGLPPLSVAARVEGRDTAPAGQLRLTGRLPAPAHGGPLVDANGAVLGVFAGGNVAAPASRAQELIQEARDRIAGGGIQTPPQTPSGDSFPWVWVGAGAGAVGLLVLLLGGPDEGVVPTTGTILITWGGSP